MMGKLAYGFRGAQGDSVKNCYFLAHRWIANNWSEDALESWIGQISDGRIVLLKGHRGWLSGIWKSPQGFVFASDSSENGGGIHINQSLDPQNPKWDYHNLSISVRGIWGLNDQMVFAWGNVPNKKEQKIVCWDGTTWNEFPVPKKHTKIASLHGQRPDLIFAVGDRGMIRHWNGKKWKKVEASVYDDLINVFVADEDHIYACGYEGVITGAVSDKHWGIPFDEYTPVADVVSCNGEVWACCYDNGLLQLSDESYFNPYQGIAVDRFYKNDHLLLIQDDQLADFIEGQVKTKISVKDFEQLIKDAPVMWDSAEGS